MNFERNCTGGWDWKGFIWRGLAHGRSARSVGSTPGEYTQTLHIHNDRDGLLYHDPHLEAREREVLMVVVREGLPGFWHNWQAFAGLDRP